VYNVINQTRLLDPGSLDSGDGPPVPVEFLYGAGQIFEIINGEKQPTVKSFLGLEGRRGSLGG